MSDRLLSITLEQTLRGDWYAYASDADRPVDPPVAEGHGDTAALALADVETRIDYAGLEVEDLLDYEPRHLFDDEFDDDLIERATEFYLV